KGDIDSQEGQREPPPGQGILQMAVRQLETARPGRRQAARRGRADLVDVKVEPAGARALPSRQPGPFHTGAGEEFSRVAQKPYVGRRIALTGEHASLLGRAELADQFRLALDLSFGPGLRVLAGLRHEAAIDVDP